MVAADLQVACQQDIVHSVLILQCCDELLSGQRYALPIRHRLRRGWKCFCRNAMFGSKLPATTAGHIADYYLRSTKADFEEVHHLPDNTRLMPSVRKMTAIYCHQKTGKNQASHAVDASKESRACQGKEVPLTATSALIRPSTTAAWIARKFEPPPETKMPRRGFFSLASRAGGLAAEQCSLCLLRAGFTAALRASNPNDREAIRYCPFKPNNW